MEQQYQKQSSRELSSVKHETMEKETLYTLIKGKKGLQQPSATTLLSSVPEEDSKGIKFNPKYGG